MNEIPPSSPAADPALEAHLAMDCEEAEYMQLRLIVPQWLRENPGLGLTCVYLVASLVGVLYDYLFLRRFGLNVLEFSETSDFLMVVVREPLTVALASLGVPFYMIYGRAVRLLSGWARRRFPRMRGSPEKRRKLNDRLRRWVPGVQVAFIAAYAIVFVMIYSLWRASTIRAGEFRRVTVEFKTDSPMAGGAIRAEGLGLLGTTSRFVFLYDSAAKQTAVVPLDSIARLIWDARTRRERQAAAAAGPLKPNPAAVTAPPATPPTKSPVPVAVPPAKP